MVRLPARIFHLLEVEQLPQVLDGRATGAAGHCHQLGEILRGWGGCSSHLMILSNWHGIKELQSKVPLKTIPGNMTTLCICGLGLY